MLGPVTSSPSPIAASPDPASARRRQNHGGTIGSAARLSTTTAAIVAAAATANTPMLGGDRHAQATPLARREAPDAVVPAELRPLLVDDRAAAGGKPVPREEVAVVAAREEARLLALRLPGGGKTGALGFDARRLLVLVAEREGDPL